jgi:hypothetical protein
MRNLLALLAFAVLAFAGAGWYLDWYKVERTPAPDGRRAYNVEVDTSKIRQDVERGTERLHDAMEGNADSNGKRAERPKAELDRPAPDQ